MTEIVEVVAAVIADARGRVLLARRTEGRDLAGLWEFPGGKREPGENPEAALARALHEELGIVAAIGPSVSAVPNPNQIWRAARSGIGGNTRVVYVVGGFIHKKNQK